MRAVCRVGSKSRAPEHEARARCVRNDSASRVPQGGCAVANIETKRRCYMSTNVVSVLNDLVETSKDGEKGFLKAAEDTRDPSLKLLFQNRAQKCAEGAREL